MTEEPDDDTRALTEVVTAAGDQVTLTEAQEAAYQRVANRFNRLLTGSDPLHRYEF